MIDVHLLRYALAAAETGSFSRAAGQFRVKQSTLSKRIRHLELRLGLSLFDRSTQGVAPTPVGLRFLARARTILGDLESLSAESQALAKGTAGRLRIGFQGSLAAGDLRAIFETYRCSCPDVELEATEGARDTLLAEVQRDQLDIAIVAGEVGVAGHRSLCLWSEPLSIGMARGHPLEARAPLYWTDLRGLTFVVTAADPGPLIAAMITARLSGPGSAPKIISQSVSRDNLVSFAGGNCVAVTAGAPAATDAALLLCEVHDAFGPTRLDQGLHWRGDNANPALKRFLALVGTRYGRSLSDVLD
ncbi:LysR family transcriptional regulator [Sphingomonas sp.]|jgi:DNA-binding transcriptional LysR family regulator|uniref:LysR substrate-binding domain-containing protein n=1 Tax=Sphingomonas sp. TaxID=28214 RepID=UPI002ED8C693